MSYNRKPGQKGGEAEIDDWRLTSTQRKRKSNKSALYRSLCTIRRGRGDPGRPKKSYEKKVQSNGPTAGSFIPATKKRGQTKRAVSKLKGRVLLYGDKGGRPNKLREAAELHLRTSSHMTARNSSTKFYGKLGGVVVKRKASRHRMNRGK